MNGVIGGAGDTEHLVTGPQHAKQRHSESVGAADKIMAHQGVLRAKGIGIDLVQNIPAPVAVAIAGAAHKVALTDPGLNKRGQHFLLIVTLGGFNLLKLSLSQLLSLPGNLQQLWIDLKSGIYVHCFSPYNTACTQVSTLEYPRPR